MFDDKHCPNCGGSKLHRFSKVGREEAAYINDKRGALDGHGWWRCTNQTPEGRCLWVQPHSHQAKGFSLPESFR
ncbi:hypothetical protein ACIHFC_01185 [Streptomyces sp. NPDC052013]|uniref:hypothetical protein n=1 Tax=Streptomyces sp. NPDC052013 TaxID=3365679 RepID=UPI0037CFE27B